MSEANDKIEPTVTVIFERKKSDGNYGSGSCVIAKPSSHSVVRDLSGGNNSFSL